jgi:reactive intermediate/imine deaminase
LAATLAARCVALAEPPAAGKKAADVEYYSGGSSLPFSPAVRVGNTLYVSGQIGALPGSKTLTLAPGGITAEARQAMENIRAILEQHGSSMDHVVKCTVFLADIKDWPAFNEVYREFFKTHFPARSALAASGLAYNARTEVECIAVIP